MDQNPLLVLKRHPSARSFVDLILSERELQNSDDIFISFDLLRAQFTDYREFVTTLMYFERAGMYTLKGARSKDLEKYMDIGPIRLQLSLEEKYAWMIGTDFDMKVNMDFVPRFLTTSSQNKDELRKKDDDFRIEKLTLFKGDERKGKLIINDDYKNHVLEVDYQNPTWKLLLAIGDSDREIEYDAQLKSSFDYLNSNSNCKIYTHLKCKPQKILKISNNVIKPAIDIEIISEKAFATRLNKASA